MMPRRRHCVRVGTWWWDIRTWAWPQGAGAGYFAQENGWDRLLDDIQLLRQETEQAYPGVPYFLLGHSMGSFLVRCYLTEHGEGLRGAVLSGTGWFGPGR